MLHYFAYGSNLHPVRLQARIPSANLVGPTRLADYRLMFHKRGQDGSGKCSLSYTGSESDSVFGAIYRIDHEHKVILDRIEGRGCGYIDRQINVQHQGQEYICFTYFAQETDIIDNLKPFHWYKELVVLGAQYLQFPGGYIASIEAVESIEDPVAERRKENELLISKALGIY